MPAKTTIARFGRIATLIGVGLVVANCNGGTKLTSKIDPKYGVSASPRVVGPGEPVPKGGGTYRVGKPYVVAGRTYVPTEPKAYRAEGLASWYGDDFHGRLTANGEVFDMHSIAAAHPTLPIPSYVRVTNVGNGRSMVVRVNDRGPYHGNRLIDVSSKAADMLGFKNRGTARVKIEYVGRAPLEGSDDIQLAATLRTNGTSPMPAAPEVMVASAARVPVLASRTTVVAANVPLPPSRPFDLGEPAEPVVAQAAVIAPVQVASKPRPAPVAAVQAPVAVVAVVKPVPPAKPVVAAKPAPAPKPVIAVTAPVQMAGAVTGLPKRAPAPKPAANPVVASATEAPPEMAGWVVGAQPAMGYASSGAVAPAGTGRGLY